MHGRDRDGGSMHGRGACVAEGGHAWWGACMAVGMVGDMYGSGCVAGSAWQGGMHGGGVRSRKDGNCSGRYASYWNAFLFVYVLKKLPTLD